MNAPVDIANMDKHWNMTHFQEADATEVVSGVYICADGASIDGRLPDPPTGADDEHNPIFDSEDDFAIDDVRGPPRTTSKPPILPPDLPNHWIMLLELARDGTAIKLDMSPGYQPSRPFREGTILVSSLSTTEFLAPTLKHLRFSVLIGAVTVQQVFENMAHNLRHRYLFSEDGQGSRYWVHTTVLDLEVAEILHEGEADRAEEVMSLVWGKEGTGGTVQKRIKRGMFTEWTMRGEKKRSWFPR